jgi:hypothetical protein
MAFENLHYSGMASKLVPWHDKYIAAAGSGGSRILILGVPWYNTQCANNKISIQWLKFWKKYTINCII